MGSYSPEDVEDLKERLSRSVEKVSEILGDNERLLEMLKTKATQTGEARRRMKELEDRDAGKTKTIRRLKQRLRKRDE